MRAVAVSRPSALVRLHDLPGSGIPLLFIHGLACASSSDYPAVARSPALSTRHVILVDLLGSGFSDKPPEFDYTVAGHARVLCDVVEALELDAIDLYGHSMGGTIALVAAATRLAGRIRHLILSEPNLDPGGGSFSRRVAGQTEAEFGATGCAELIGRTAAAGDQTQAGVLAATPPFVVHRGAVSLVQGGTPDWREQLLGLSTPRTMLFGARSLPDPDVERLPPHGIRVAVIPEAGHGMAWENPSGLAAAIAGACRS